MAKKFRLFGEFSKVEPQDDGTVKVSGIASSESVDAVGETIKADAIRAAIPDYMKFGAVREQHDPMKAAGTALAIQVNDAGQTEFEALIVDPVTCKKVETGVLKGFSVGGKVLSRDTTNKNIITGLKLTEVSVVDVPCNPDCVMQLAKLDNDTEDEMDLESLRKYLGEEVWDAGTAIQALDNIMYLLSKELGEAEQMPEQIQALKDAAQRLKDFIASEIMEDNSQKAAGVDGLAKKGAKFSKTTKSALQKVQDAHGSLGECMKALADAFTADDDKDDDEDESEKAAKAELQKAADELTKAKSEAAELSESLNKANAERDDLKKAHDKLAEDLKKAEAEKADLQAKLETKGASKVVPVSKGADAGVIGGDGALSFDPDDPVSVMKAAQSRPLPVSYNPNRPATLG